MNKFAHLCTGCANAAGIFVISIFTVYISGKSKGKRERSTSMGAIKKLGMRKMAILNRSSQGSFYTF